MMHITIIAVGRLKERFWSDACAEYLKRLSAYAAVSVRELPDLDPSRAGGEQKAIDGESADILKAIPAHSHVILLDVKSTPRSSEEIAQRIEEISLEGMNDVVCILGGSCGVNKDVKKCAQERWSFGPITLPHNLARVVLLEQLYRAFKILRNEPYHK